jgi:hypothetical protein
MRRCSVTKPAPDGLSDVWRAQAHWAALKETNYQQVPYGFGLLGAIPQLTEEAMHVAVSRGTGASTD